MIKYTNKFNDRLSVSIGRFFMDLEYMDKLSAINTIN